MAFLLLVRQHVTLLENRRLVQRLAETESLLRHQATHDHLTGLAGRVLLLERLQKITTMPSVTAFPVALIFIDLDGFKAVNDRHGHAGGDHLLMEVARRLGRLLEPVGDSALAVRVSGDEFAVLLERDQAIAAEPLARQILDELTHPINVNGAVVSVGASVGVASATSASLDASRLLAAADEAMYRMKREGKGGVEIADGALPTQGRNARPSPHVALGAPIDDERSVAMNDHSWSDKAKGALPDDDTVEQASDKVQDKSPDQVDTEVAKAEQWTKDHNKD
nr:GGDEF domain-containing protein [Demequina sp. TTPB684]